MRARRSNGSAFDVFDVLDRLSPDYPLLYLVDLDGIERNDPQLEYIQELSRDMPLWVDAGVRTAEGAIDVLVAGSQKAVLSSAHLRGPRELRRSWRLSTELVFELQSVAGQLAPIDPGWASSDVAEVARAVRAVGVTALILSARGTDPDWGQVRALAADGPTWVDGAFSASETSQLAASGAAGGIFHIDEILRDMDIGRQEVAPGTSDAR